MSSVWPIRTLRSAAGAMAEAKFVDANSAGCADGYSPKTGPSSSFPGSRKRAILPRVRRAENQPLPRRMLSRSIGSGKMIVELFSPAMLASVPR